MAEQKRIQKKIRFALSSQTSKGNLSFVVLLMLMSLMRTRLKCCDNSRILSSMFFMQYGGHAYFLAGKYFDVRSQGQGPG